MLNRRILRGKVMQQLFAYKTCLSAHAEMARESVIEHFSPDLNANEVQDAKKLEGYAKLSLTLLDTYFKTDTLNLEGNVPPEVITFLPKITNTYLAQNKKERHSILNKMLADCEYLFHYYLMILDLVCKLAYQWKEIKKSALLVNNQVIKALSSHPDLAAERDKRNITWANDEDVVSQLFTVWQNDELFKTYHTTPTPTFEQDKELILHLLKNVIFKNAAVHDFFEAKNIHWSEDKAAVKDMCLDTIKQCVPNLFPPLATISKNWDDDKLFVSALYNLSLENEAEFEALLSPKLKNWDISRLTATDSIILKLCLCELLYFPSIPVKVSLNEYIEVAKRYSTPKSKTLINGVLDNLANELAANGKIKKSGRGLMDNR